MSAKSTSASSERRTVKFEFSPPLVSAIILSSCLLLYLCAFHPSLCLRRPLLGVVHSTAIGVFRSQSALIVVWYAALCAHFAEAAYVVYLLATKSTTSLVQMLAWAAQTVCVGFPSTRLLVKRVAQANKKAQR